MCLHPVIYNKQVITVQLLTRELQGVPGISASLALTKTLAMTCDIGKGRLSDVPAMRKKRVFPASPCFASALRGFSDCFGYSFDIDATDFACPFIHLGKFA